MIMPIGSRDACLTVYNTDNGLYCMTGCFFGTLGKFTAEVKEAHGDNQYGVEYHAAIAMISKIYEESLTADEEETLLDSERGIDRECEPVSPDEERGR
jgi:hypothetical protein